MPATVEPALWGVPAMRHEAACASGSMALLAAMAEIEAGRYDVALVLGAEIEKTVGGDLGAQYLGAAAWIGHEGQDATFMWPYMFDRLADEYDRRYGLDDRVRARHRRAERPQRPEQPERPDPRLEVHPGELHRRRRGQPLGRGPGPAHRLQRDDRRRGRHRRRQRPLPGRPTPTLAARPQAADPRAGATARSACRCSRSSTTRPTTQYVLPHVRQTILDAFDRAGIADVDQLDAIETHDCFSMSEYAAIDHFGITGARRQLEGRRQRRPRDRRPDPGQPQRRPDRRRPPGRRDRRAHGARRLQAGHRPGRRLPGRRGARRWPR